ncbi:MAG: TPM domain-containing protein [Neisseriaceae bacterium]|nr:TPM domain-containing protein [Neisseriaceae bacterium]
MNLLERLWQHWIHPRFRVERYFPQSELQIISTQIAASEQNHLGQIRFVVESSLSTADILNRLDTKTRARQWFSRLNVWDTEQNCGVLVYINFADRAVEIVVDRGIHHRVDVDIWQNICTLIQHEFIQEHYILGLKQGLEAIDSVLQKHFPRGDATKENELPDDVIIA